MADEEPRNVKDLLIEAKDSSELMVDLAYAALFFNEESLAEEVESLEERLGGHLRRLRTVAMLAARSPEDAEAMEGVPDFIVERQLGHLAKVHPDYAAGVRAALDRKP